MEDAWSHQKGYLYVNPHEIPFRPIEHYGQSGYNKLEVQTSDA